VRLKDPDAPLPGRYPFSLPWVKEGFELTFVEPVTILMGENGSGKSTLLEAIAALAGFATSGGGNWAGGDLSHKAEDAEALAASMLAGWLA
jgi:predicted ATPase